MRRLTGRDWPGRWDAFCEIVGVLTPGAPWVVGPVGCRTTPGRSRVLDHRHKPSDRATLTSTMLRRGQGRLIAGC